MHQGYPLWRTSNIFELFFLCFDDLISYAIAINAKNCSSSTSNRMAVQFQDEKLKFNEKRKFGKNNESKAYCSNSEHRTSNKADNL